MGARGDDSHRHQVGGEKAGQRLVLVLRDVAAKNSSWIFIGLPGTAPRDRRLRTGRKDECRAAHQKPIRIERSCWTGRGAGDCDRGEPRNWQKGPDQRAGNRDVIGPIHSVQRSVGRPHATIMVLDGVVGAGILPSIGRGAPARGARPGREMALRSCHMAVRRWPALPSGKGVAAGANGRRPARRVFRVAVHAGLVQEGRRDTLQVERPENSSGGPRVTGGRPMLLEGQEMGFVEGRRAARSRRPPGAAAPPRPQPGRGSVGKPGLHEERIRAQIFRIDGSAARICSLRGISEACGRGARPFQAGRRQNRGAPPVGPRVSVSAIISGGTFSSESRRC